MSVLKENDLFLCKHDFLKTNIIMKYLSFLFLALSISFVNCDRNGDEPVGPDEPVIFPPVEQQGNIEDYQSMSVDYGLSMFQDVVGEGDENVLISPYSLQSALFMTMNGAKDETLEEFRTALNTGDFYADGLRTYYEELAKKMIPSGDNTSFNSQNKIYYYPSFFTPDENYISEIESFYSGTFSEEDFSDPGTVDVINGWVNDVTEGRIEKVLDQIQSDEALFLINALVFTADWSLGFEPNATYDRPFTKMDGTEIEVPTMSSDDMRSYMQNDYYSAIDLPVKDEDYAVTFILPNELIEIDDFVSTFDPFIYNEIYDNLQTDRVQLYLPKFELATSMNMKDILIERGMTKTFESADLSGMGQFAGNEYLTRVLHDVLIKVDEKGIEGAAVTTVGVGVESVPPTLVFNRPFVFVVRHVETRVPIFIGKVGDPL